MTYHNELISVGNPEKGYALFNKTTGEYLTDFDYSNIVNTAYGLHFLYKGEDQSEYIIMDNDGKELNFDKNYFWGALGRNSFGIGVVAGLNDNKYYLANCKGEILSKGYDRRLICDSPTSRIFEATNVDQNSGRKLKSIVTYEGVELVPCIDEHLPTYDDVFVLTELIEKYGFGLIKYASDEILASDMIFIKLFESAIKSLRTLPDVIDKVSFVMSFANYGVSSMYYLRSDICFEKGIARNKCTQLPKEIFVKFENLINTLFEEGVISNRITANYLNKQVNNILEKLVGNPDVFVF